MTALTAEDRRYKVLKQNAMQAETYLAELQVKLSRAEDEFMCAHKKVIEQILKCREAIKIAEAFEYKFQIARSTYNEAARQSRSYNELLQNFQANFQANAQRTRIFKNFQANAQRLQFFELGDCPLKRELDAMLEI